MRRIISILALFLVALPLVKAQTSISVQAPNVVAADEQFNVTFIVEGENSPSDFEWSEGEDFQLVWGPQKGTSTSLTIVNGKRTKSSQTTYTYVLMPRKTGKFQIASATATVKGNKIHSNAATVEVVSGGATNSGQSSGNGSSDQSSSSTATGDISQDDLFLRFSLSKTSAVVGEPITATLKLYQRVNIAGFEDAKFPAFTGFWSQEVLAPTNIEFQRESLRDKIYNSAVIRSWTIIPQQSGTLTIEPAELVCLVNVRSSASTGSIFDSFFMDDYRTIRKRVYSDSYKVNVAGLPAGAPASFHGGVGSFTMEAYVSKDSLKAHDAASLVVKVSGKGNVSLLEAPVINFPPDFEVYDVKVTEAAGSKTFEFPFIPRSHGEFVIDPVEYSYFDISNRKYVTLRSDQMNIKVAPGAGGSATTSGGTLVQGANRKDVKDLGSDIRFIVTEKPSFSQSGAFLFGSTAFWIITLLLAGLAFAAWFFLRKMSVMKADVVGQKNRKAVKMAQKRLSSAGEYLSKNLYTAFYEELHKALIGYVSDKLNMDFADMSKENISETLISRGVTDETSSRFTDLLDACEFARYSPDAGHDAMSSHYETALDVITAIDSSMKKTSSGKRSAAGSAASVILLLLSVSMQANAQTADYPDSLWTVGTQAYLDGRWTEACDAWSSISALGIESCELYYNIGNSYFKMGDYSHAILNYERARRLDPSDADVAHNLEFANSMIQDKIEVIPDIFFEAWGRKVCWKLPSDTWTVMFFLFFALALGCGVVFFLSGGRRRKICFYSGIVLLLVALLCVDFAQWQKSDYIKDTSAIITRAVTSVKSSPSRESSTDLFILHEGTKVKVLDTVGDWNNIELSDGRQGWIKGSDIEMI